MIAQLHVYVTVLYIMLFSSAPSPRGHFEFCSCFVLFICSEKRSLVSRILCKSLFCDYFVLNQYWFIAVFPVLRKQITFKLHVPFVFYKDIGQIPY